MGKIRKSKIRAKVNPIGIPSVSEIERNEDDLLDESNPGGPIQAIIDQLQSISVEEKMNALQSLATLSMNEEKVKLICASEIVRIASPLLVEQNQALRNATAGALRNLSINGSTCLVEQDVLTPLLALLTEYVNTPDWTPTFDQSMKNQLDQKSDTFLQAICILWHLCESTSVALENFNQTQMLPNLIRYLNYKIFGTEISIAVAQFFLIISEDNPSSWVILNEHVHDLLSLLSIDDTVLPVALLRTLSAGILANVPALCAGYSSQILSAISKTLELNHRLLLGQITSKIPLHFDDYSSAAGTSTDEISDEGNMDEESEEEAVRRRRRQDLPTELEIEIRNVGYLLQAQRIAIETITNLCSPDDNIGADGFRDDNNDDDDSGDESVKDYDVSNEGSSSSSMMNLQNLDKLSIEISEAIKSLGLIEKLWLKAQPIPENVTQILRQNENELWLKVKKLRIASLICLQNLCNVMCTDDLGGPNALYGVWLDLGQQVFQGIQDTQLIEAATSLMRSAIDHLKKNPELFKQMTENDLQLMLDGVQNCKIPEIRANWLRMLGILGSLLSESLVKCIITFLLDICSQEQDAWTLSEGIDAIMDIFADNDWNQIVYELQLQQKTKQLEKLLKTKVRQQKRDLNERYPAVLTVQSNLQRFTKYVEKQMRGYRP